MNQEVRSISWKSAEHASTLPSGCSSPGVPALQRGPGSAASASNEVKLLARGKCNAERASEL